MQIILSTRNPSKAEQVKWIFNDSRFRILTLEEAGIEGEAVENGRTLKENALKKAMFAHRVGESWSMADDTGIFIDALSGQPGVFSARWAGKTATTGEITLHTLKLLEGIINRSATFQTVAAVISPFGEHYFFSGEVRGKLLDAPRVPPKPEMPYSPLFVPDGQEKVLAEMTIQYENSISHRGKAFLQVREFLKRLPEYAT